MFLVSVCNNKEATAHNLSGKFAMFKWFALTTRRIFSCQNYLISIVIYLLSMHNPLISTRHFGNFKVNHEFISPLHHLVFANKLNVLHLCLYSNSMTIMFLDKAVSFIIIFFQEAIFSFHTGHKTVLTLEYKYVCKAKQRYLTINFKSINNNLWLSVTYYDCMGIVRLYCVSVSWQ